MRIVFFSYGTRGDAQPQVSLAAGLRERGFDVRVAAPENLKGFVERAGIEYAPLHGNSQAILESEEGQRWLRSGNVRAFMKSVGEINREIDPFVFKCGLEAARDADAIVGGTLTEEMAVTLAEHLELPFAFAHTIPFETTGEYPCPLVTQAKLPFAFLNRATYALFRQLAFPVHRDALNVFRRELGLPPQTTTVLSRARELGLPAVQLWSQHIVPHPADAAEQTVTAGSIRVPSIVCSFFADQPFWGSRIAALGTGAHVPFEKLSQRTLRAALQQALSDDTRQRAAALGEKLRAEDGNTRALDALERVFTSKPRRQTAAA